MGGFVEWIGVYGSKWAHKAIGSDGPGDLEQVLRELVRLGINLPVTQTSNPLDGTNTLSPPTRESKGTIKWVRFLGNGEVYPK